MTLMLVKMSLQCIDFCAYNPSVVVLSALYASTAFFMLGSGRLSRTLSTINQPISNPNHCNSCSIHFANAMSHVAFSCESISLIISGMFLYALFHDFHIMRFIAVTAPLLNFPSIISQIQTCAVLLVSASFSASV